MNLVPFIHPRPVRLQTPGFSRAEARSPEAGGPTPPGLPPPSPPARRRAQVRLWAISAPVLSGEAVEEGAAGARQGTRRAPSRHIYHKRGRLVPPARPLRQCLGSGGSGTTSRPDRAVQSPRGSQRAHPRQRSSADTISRRRSERHAHCASHSFSQSGAGSTGRNSLHRHVHGIRSVFMALVRGLQAMAGPEPRHRLPSCVARICRPARPPCGLGVWQEEIMRIDTIGRFMG